MGKRVSGMFQGGKSSGFVETVRVDPLNSLVLLGCPLGVLGSIHELLFCFAFLAPVLHILVAASNPHIYSMFRGL